jgi:small redox-active disulfide protein 2
MEIKILGMGCSNCKALYANVEKAVKELGLDATVEEVKDLQKIMEYNVMSLPAIVIDEKVAAVGVLSCDSVKKLLSK